MPAKKKSYGIVTIDPDGMLPVLPSLAKDFGVRAGDFVGIRSRPDGKLELSFWRQLRPKGCCSPRRILPPEQMVEVKRVRRQPARRKSSA